MLDIRAETNIFCDYFPAMADWWKVYKIQFLRPVEFTEFVMAVILAYKQQQQERKFDYKLSNNSMQK
jgi:hypothetical protein